MERRKLRIAPSGPFLENDEGGFAVPGPGFQIRLDEQKATCGGTITNTATELGSGSLRAGLTACSPNLNYKASCQINTWEQVDGANTVVTMRIERSLDAGATWASVSTDVFGVFASDTGRMSVCNVEMQLGSEDWAIAAEGTDMLIRCMVSTQSEDNTATMPTFQGFISLAELL